MDKPAGQLSWQIHAQQPEATSAAAVREAVDTVAYWLELWGEVVTATVAGPVQVTVMIRESGDSGVDVSRGKDGFEVLVAVPESLIISGSAALRFELLNRIFDAVEAIAIQWPPEVLAKVWEPQEDPQHDDDQALATSLEMLESDELILFGRLDGASLGELSRFHQLDDYVLDSIDRSGIAVVTDTEGGCSTASWTVELNDSS
ncbi:MAG TPA: hypothetical protein VFX61_15005 [Micromonosporaceae bacterium]|nr:hypothetical protein [Micromonosporaceae bacterium]